MLEEDDGVVATRESERVVKKNRWHVKYSFTRREACFSILVKTVQEPQNYAQVNNFRHRNASI